MVGESSRVNIVFVDSVRSVFVLYRNVLIPTMFVSVKAVVCINVDPANVSDFAVISECRQPSAWSRSAKMLIASFSMFVLRFNRASAGWFV